MGFLSDRLAISCYNHGKRVKSSFIYWGQDYDLEYRIVGPFELFNSKNLKLDENQFQVWLQGIYNRQAGNYQYQTDS